MSRQQVLVDADWVEEHRTDDNVVLVEVDEDTSAYDGGHIAGAVYERIRAAVARVRGRPDPGPFDIARLMPVAYVVAGLFLVLSGLLFIADIVNPITLG